MILVKSLPIVNMSLCQRPCWEGFFGNVIGYRQRRHAHWTCPLRFLSQADFDAASKRQKNSRFIFSICNTIATVGASYHQLLNSNLRSMIGAETDAFYSAAHYNQSHTILLSLWMQLTNQRSSESSLKDRCFLHSLADRIPLSVEISSETSKCKSVCNFTSVNSVSDFNGSAWTLLTVKMLYDKVCSISVQWKGYEVA